MSEHWSNLKPDKPSEAPRRGSKAKKARPVSCRPLGYAPTCEAPPGFHAGDCPGESWGSGDTRFVPHHVWTRGSGGPDHPSNLRWLFNGGTVMGRGGCHGQIHDRWPTAARAVGLLQHGEDDPVHGIGIDAALADGWLTIEQVPPELRPEIGAHRKATP